ncbi:hypothetical protein GGP45_003089 [Salinibacter ruber]|uniref:Uncharacterized protein n=1 Tax=Salinibacter ruber TaxID=146919 RepID=A0A9X2V7F3_9BACT|nr:hypothetical protein [Salinibacter ruber]
MAEAFDLDFYDDDPEPDYQRLMQFQRDAHAPFESSTGTSEGEQYRLSLNVRVILIRAQVGKLHFPYDKDRGMRPVGIIFRNPFTYQ